MAIRLCALASGSKGNCTLVSSDRAHVLVDCGLNQKQLQERLAAFSLRITDLDAVMVTHAHDDHVSGVQALIKNTGIPVFAPEEVAHGMLRKKNARYDTLRIFDGHDFFFEDFTVSPLPVPHDVPCYGYSFYAGGSKATVITDIGKIARNVIENIKDSDIVVLECNHDTRMVERNPMYPLALKQRILGAHGHLSNEDCSLACVELARSGVKQIVLAHLSEQNNSPELALACVNEGLNSSGVVVGRDIYVDIAWQNKVSRLYEIV